MSSISLANKYRPSSFEEVVGQLHIVDALKEQLRTKKVGKAYLFAGKHGTGKTTIARIFAKSLLCQAPDEDGEFCGNCSSCHAFSTESFPDYFEIDGASYNGVENIRNLNESVRTLPVISEYKVVVIDEVHMLSTAAFNALLKTLEEPPAHLIFLFATTDPQKVLPTVVSRCYFFDLKDPTQAEIKYRLQGIAGKEERGEIEDSILNTIVEAGRGSVRDSVKYLGQLLSGFSKEELTLEKVQISLGVPSLKLIDQMINSVWKCERDEVLERSEDLLKYSTPEKIGEKFLKRLYSRIISSRSKMSPSQQAEILWIYESFNKDIVSILNSLCPIESFEIGLLKLASRNLFFGKSETTKSEKKKTESEDSKRPEFKRIKLEQSKFWNFLKENSPSYYSQLVQAKISEYQIDDTSVNIRFLFPEAHQVFYENFLDPKTSKKFKKFLSGALSYPQNEISVFFETSSDDFETEGQRLDAIVKKQKEAQKLRLLNDPQVIKLKELFKAEIREINLKD